MINLPERAISVRQPWAWLIVYAGKNIENRTWISNFRGPVCIHAAKGHKRSDWDLFHEWAASKPGLKVYGKIMKPSDHMMTGGIIGIANVTDCVLHHPSDWFMGPVGYVLENVKPVDFIPVAGALSFFDWRKRL